MRKVGFLVVCWVFLWGSVFSQEAPYSIRNYTAVNGLPQSQVGALVEDGNGYLWLGTMGGGLARFDGREFKVFTTKDGLASNDVVGLVFDNQQHLWILCSVGITRYDGSTFRNFQAADANVRSKRFRRVLTRADTLFAISDEGLMAKIHGDSVYYWGNKLQGKAVKRYFAGKNEEHVFYVEDSTFVVWTKNDSYNFRSDEPFGRIYTIFTRNDDLLFRSDRGIFHLDYKAKKITKLPWRIDNHVLAYDSERDVFWTKSNAALMQEKITGDRVVRDTVLHDSEIYSVVIDSEGNTWFASNGQGLFKYFIQDFNRVGPNNTRGVMAIAKDKDENLWIGSMTQGLWRISKDGRTREFHDDRDAWRNNIRTMRVAPDGTVWIAAGAGLAQYDKRSDALKWFPISKESPIREVNSLDFDNKGHLWMGSHRGVGCYDGKQVLRFDVSNGLLSNRVWYVHYSSLYNAVFVGMEFGLQAIRDGKLQTYHIPGLNNSGVLSIQPYRQSQLVISTAGGGIVIYNPSNGHHRFITTQEGLASDFVYFAAEDENHNVWVGTEKGLNRLKLNANLEVEENLYYGYDNGLTGVETNSNAFYLDPQDKYFGLVDGLYRLNDVSDESRKSFNVHLTDVQIFYNEYDPRMYADSTSGAFNLPVNPQLPPDKNHVTFAFNRVDKRYSQSIKFRYFLEGFDKKWSQPSSNTSVTYSNLPPGDYVFRVKSTDKRGSWAGGEVSYPFSVKTPFYQTASFMVGVFVLIGGIITLILYLRVKQRVNKMVELERIRIREQESLRKEIARDFHDEMGNQLTRIINYVSLLKLNGQANGNGHTNGHYANGHGDTSSHNGNGNLDLYTKVENSAKYLYSGTRDFIWAIDPVNDELSKLFIHIRDFGEKIFEEKAIQFRAFNDVREKVKLPYGFSRQANLIFKEAMTNAFKYSQACNVTLSLTRTGADTFEMSMEDDGIGFSTVEVEKANGLQNIRERADKLQAILRIHSVKEQGTKITLSFKLNKKLNYGIAL